MLILHPLLAFFSIVSALDVAVEPVAIANPPIVKAVGPEPVAPKQPPRGPPRPVLKADVDVSTVIKVVMVTQVETLLGKPPQTIKAPPKPKPAPSTPQKPSPPKATPASQPPKTTAIKTSAPPKPSPPKPTPSKATPSKTTPTKAPPSKKEIASGEKTDTEKKAATTRKARPTTSRRNRRFKPFNVNDYKTHKTKGSFAIGDVDILSKNDGVVQEPGLIFGLLAIMIPLIMGV
jgi:outer membrane biosynthesis protein TonB